MQIYISDKPKTLNRCNKSAVFLKSQCNILSGKEAKQIKKSETGEHKLTI